VTTALNTTEGTSYTGEEARTRALIFGEVTRAKANFALSSNLSKEGKMAAASPGPGFPRVLEKIWDTIRPNEGVRVADLGAGLGGAAAWMVERGGSVTAYEVEPECVKAGRALFPELDLRVGDAELVALHPFEVVTAFGLLSLCADPCAVVASVAQRLGVSGPVRRKWIVSADLVAAGDQTIYTERNVVVPVSSFVRALPDWDLITHHVIEPSERRSLWHDISVAVHMGCRSNLPQEALEALDDDIRTLDRLIDSETVHAALTIFATRS
jgi:2-polyprenyl-3-methyl-5-hydroxy-6-metoxy-1,4-benzoquinol methylase